MTVSTLPGAVSGGQVLVEVRGLRPGDRLRVLRGKSRVPKRNLRPAGRGVRRGLVGRLKRGRTVLTARVRGRGKRRRAARLAIRNHSIAGPVISGPHQKPFYCETEESGLGAPLDRNCSIDSQADWFYRSTNGGTFQPLADPYGAYPADTDTAKTSSGKTVPFVVRVESATVNRGTARIAVLDDPRARGRDRPFRPALWNRRLTYSFGESCGVGYRQGSNSANNVLGGAPTGAEDAFSGIYGLGERLARGDVVAASTLTTFGVHCNPLISAETLMMLKERIIETYGVVDRTIGVGGSGGALQQYNAVNNFPGLLDGAIPIASFTDIPSTAMTTVDCGLLNGYYRRSSLAFSDAQRTAISGQLTTQICNDWEDSFLPRLDPANGCDGAVPDDVRYDPQTRPKGVRCTLQDGNVNVYGTDARGFANRPYDNAGVQYGLGALTGGQIDAARFLDLNRSIGGYDIDGRPQAARSTMSARTARVSYKLGGVVGRGAIARTPIIDLATYLEPIPVLGFHDIVRPFMHRARLREHQGSDRSQAIWRGVSTPGDAYGALESWVDAIDRRGGHSAARVRASQPPAAGDRCIVTGTGTRIENGSLVGPVGIRVPLPIAGATLAPGTNIPEAQEARGGGLCQSVFTARSEPRIVAGGPLADDVIKCRLRPVDPADYAGKLTPAQVDEVRAIFPRGVCDYSKPGVGEVAKSIVWPTIGAAKRLPARSLRWTSGRSRR